MQMNWIGPAVLAAAAVTLLIGRRTFAGFQANILGGSVLPGCVVAQGVALLIVAAVMWILG